MQKNNASIVLAILLFMSLTATSYALDVKTHQAINLTVSEGTLGGAIFNARLKELGFSQGLKEEFAENKTAQQWLELGGLYEDKPGWCVPYTRSLNHFHNPITNAGLGWSNSALTWATMPANSQNTCGNYSWADARRYYMQALTSSTKAQRDNAFAQTFRGIGQLMHLVQDMSVPEHTRMDIHLMPYGDYEHYVVNHAVNLTPKHYAGYIPSISVLFDTGAYNGTNPVVTDSGSIGLSEFTNANFLSDDTIFTGFAYPRIEDTELWYDSARNRKYLRKPAVTAAGVSTGAGVEHLAAVSWLYFYRLRYYPQDRRYIPVALDNNVYADYASLLLPRAAGYSADLLSHFFRGRIDMKDDKKNPGTYTIVNSSDENMNGVFSLYYDAVDGKRRLADNADLSSVNNVDLGAHTEASISSFAEPSDIKEKGRYILVFIGTLGHEHGAVIGKAVTLGGMWEDWDSGTYTTTAHNAYAWPLGKGGWYFHHANEFFTLQTGKRLWEGYWRTGESPAPSISVDNGELNINAANGGWPLGGFDKYYISFSQIWLWSVLDADRAIPLAGCSIKIKTPSAEAGFITYPGTGAWGGVMSSVELNIVKGGNNFRITYVIDNVSGDYIPGILPGGYMRIPTGVTEQRLEDGFNNLRNTYYWFNFGDISDWKVTQVMLHYNVPGSDNFMHVSGDYIDFVCDK